MSTQRKRRASSALQKRKEFVRILPPEYRKAIKERFTEEWIRELIAQHKNGTLTCKK